MDEMTEQQIKDRLGKVRTLLALLHEEVHEHDHDYPNKSEDKYLGALCNVVWILEQEEEELVWEIGMSEEEYAAATM